MSQLVRGDTFFQGPLMAGALLGSVPVPFIYSFFVESYMSAMTGAVKGRGEGHPGPPPVSRFGLLRRIRPGGTLHSLPNNGEGRYYSGTSDDLGTIGAPTRETGIEVATLAPHEPSSHRKMRLTN